MPSGCAEQIPAAEGTVKQSVPETAGGIGPHNQGQEKGEIENPGEWERLKITMKDKIIKIIERRSKAAIRARDNQPVSVQKAYCQGVVSGLEKLLDEVNDMDQNPKKE